jgi:hypothetical protein
MKKRNIIIAAAAAIVLCMIVLIVALSPGKTNTAIQEGPSASPTQTETIPSKDLESKDPQKPQQTASLEPTKQKEPLGVNKENYDFKAGIITGWANDYLEQIEKKTEKHSMQKLDIPVYNDDIIIYGLPNELTTVRQPICLTPGLDVGVWKDRNSVTHYLTPSLLAAFPNDAWRDMGDGRKYLMYDTDKGTRLFFFFGASNNYFHYLGFPVIMTQKVSYEEMKGLKIGNTIDDVIAIDSSAKYVKISNPRYSDIWVKNMEKLGCPTTSVHLLTDGVMKITYERTGEKDNYVYTITDIQYHENFDIECIEGTFNYKIAEIDYVD